MSETWVDDFKRCLDDAEKGTLSDLLTTADVIHCPLRVDFEPREQMNQPRTEDGCFAASHPRIAIKSGPFTLFTIGDYFDGGYDGLAARLELVCRTVNESLNLTSDPIRERMAFVGQTAQRLIDRAEEARKR